MYKYRSLEAWKRAHAAVIAVLQATGKSGHPRTWSLFDQLRRAVISIEANIVEGYALGTPALYRRHLRIAFGSAAESECLIRCASELNYMPQVTIDEITSLLDGTMRTLHGLLRNPVIVPNRPHVPASPLPRIPTSPRPQASALSR